MKRTKMLDRLENIINQYRINDELTAADSEALAHRILDYVEELGMKPPPVDFDTQQAIMQVYYGGYSYYQWDEDVAKDEKVMDALSRRLIAQEARRNRQRES